MDVVVWTVIFVGGDIAILLFLMIWAARKDREKAMRAQDGSTSPEGG